MSDFDWAYGAWLGDGGVSKHSGSKSGYVWFFESSEKWMVDRFRQAMSWSAKGGISKRHGRREHYCISSTKSSLPTDCNSYNKKFPEYIFSSSDRDKLDFLQGLIDTDGTYDPKCNRIRYGTVSPYLAEGFSLLLDSLGVPSRITKVYTKVGCGYCYNVGLQGGHALKLGLSKHGVVPVEGNTDKNIVVEIDFGISLCKEMQSNRNKKSIPRDGMSQLMNYIRTRNRISKYLYDKYLKIYGSSGPLFDKVGEMFDSLPRIAYIGDAKEVEGIYGKDLW